MEYIITFVEGIASFISPCILPIIPQIINSLGFVSGFSIIFILLGIFAGTFGNLVHKYSSYINIVLGIFLIIIGLNYAGIVFIKFLNKTKEIKQKENNLTFITSVLFGMIFSLSWTPCVGAFLSSALILASQVGSTLKGGVLLLIYSIGLGLPFIITTIFMERVKGTFNFIKRNYNIINKLAGSILILSGIYNVINGIKGII